jgi:hypothetical protein
MGRRLSLTLMAAVYGSLLATLAYLIVSGWSFPEAVRGLCTYCWIPDPWVWPTFAIGGAAGPPIAWLWNHHQKTKQWEEENQPKQDVDFPEDGSPPILRQEDDGGSDVTSDDDRKLGLWFWDTAPEAPGEVGEAFRRSREEVIEGDFHRGSLEPEDDD